MNICGNLGIKFFLLILYMLSFLSFLSLFWIELKGKDFLNHFQTESRVGVYRHLSFNPLTNVSTYSTVSKYEKVKDKTSMFYIDRFSSYNLLSSFGTIEFICSGNCYCEDEVEERRTFSSSISRNLLFLVASTTSIVAYNKAKEYFREECKSSFSSSCSTTSSIRSDVIACRSVSGDEDEGAHNIDSSENKEVTNEKPVKDIRKYHCFGSCIPKKFKKDDAQELADSFGCNKLRKIVELKMDCTGKEPRRCNNDAKRKFGQTFLVDMCKRESVSDYIYINPSGAGVLKRVKLCVAFSKSGFNPSIGCRQVYPPYRIKRYLDEKGLSDWVFG